MSTPPGDVSGSSASDVFGSGGRIGYICPSTLERFAREFYELMPRDIALVAATMSIARIDEEHVDRALGEITARALQLAATGADRVYVAGLPLFFRGGVDLDRAMRTELEAATGLPCMTDLTNIHQAHTRVGARRILLVSPFTDAVNARIAQAFAGCGLDVIGEAGHQLDRQADYQRLPLAAATEQIEVLLSSHPDAEGVFVACGRFAHVPDVPALEEHFGLPVLTANQVVLWWALDALRRQPVKPAGRLLDALSDPFLT